MRKTKFTFFIILVFLTGVLLFIIIGEDTNYSNSSRLAANLSDIEILPADTRVMIDNYQNALSDILYEYQQLILRQSIEREDAVAGIREKVLAISQIPVELQSLHLRLVIALSRDLNGYTEEAIIAYQELQSEYNWLFSRFNFLVQ